MSDRATSTKLVSGTVECVAMMIISKKESASLAVMARLGYLVLLFLALGHGAVLTAIVTDPPRD